MSPYAECFIYMNGDLNHLSKSKFLKFSMRCNRDIIYSMNMLQSVLETESIPAKEVSPAIYETNLAPYLTLQRDVINALHYRGDSGERGTSLVDIVTGKMKTVLGPWITAERVKLLTQIHLDIDDPTEVIAQKLVEQKRRDATRSSVRIDMNEDDDTDRSLLVFLPFDAELNIPWSSLLTDRSYKDELSSFELLCGALAASELLPTFVNPCSIFLHGGSFAMTSDFNTFCANTIAHFVPERAASFDNIRERFRWGVILKHKPAVTNRAGDLIAVPRQGCLSFQKKGCNHSRDKEIKHG